MSGNNTMNAFEQFEQQKQQMIQALGADRELQELTRIWANAATKYNYSYHFCWLGRPIIQVPQDMIAMQEIIWQVKPDLIIETGIAHGGSLIFYASMLELIGGEGQVLGLDIDIRTHNRLEIEQHPMFKRITMWEGSSIEGALVEQVYRFAEGKQRVLVCLDSNHTHAHVARELALYAPLVTKDSYLVVFDTIIEDLDGSFFEDRPWGKGNNPKTAVWEFLAQTDRFQIDNDLENKLLLTVAPDGHLKCVKE